MMGCEGWVAVLWSRDDEGLDEATMRELEEHLAACPSCTREADRIATIREALEPAPDEEPPGRELLDRVRSRLASTAPLPTDDILSPEELAAMLKVPVEEIFAHLDELPAFEFAGRVRFRRRAVEDWMSEQESRWRRQTTAGAVRARPGPR